MREYLNNCNYVLIGAPLSLNLFRTVNRGFCSGSHDGEFRAACSLPLTADTTKLLVLRCVCVPYVCVLWESARVHAEPSRLTFCRSCRITRRESLELADLFS